MSFLEWVQKHWKMGELNELQWTVVKIVNEGLSEKAITQLFYGRKACPYRIVQRLWVEYSFQQERNKDLVTK